MKKLGKNNLITFINFVLFSAIFSSILDIFYKIIDNKFAANEYANTLDYTGSYASQTMPDVHTALTLLIVLTPILAGFLWYKKKIVDDSQDKDLEFMTPLNKVIMYGSVAVSSVVIVSTFITSVYIFLGGKQTIAGQLTLVVNLVMFGLVLAWSIAIIKYAVNTRANNIARILFITIMFVVGVISLVLGLKYANPREIVNSKADLNRIQDLATNISEAKYYLDVKGDLPKDAESFKDLTDTIYISKDAEGKAYDYKLISNNLSKTESVDSQCVAGQLKNGNTKKTATESCKDITWSGDAKIAVCATFDSSFKNDKKANILPNNISYWEHASGYQCFTQVLKAEMINNSYSPNYNQYNQNGSYDGGLDSSTY